MKRILSALVAIALSAGLAWGITATGTNSQYQNSNFKVGFLQMSALNAVTAFAGGGQTSAVQIADGITRVTTVASAADSVKLPLAKAGTIVLVINAAAANAVAIFPATGDVINALSANASISVAANKTIYFVCAVDGTWNSILTA